MVKCQLLHIFHSGTTEEIIHQSEIEISFRFICKLKHRDTHTYAEMYPNGHHTLTGDIAIFEKTHKFCIVVEYRISIFGSIPMMIIMIHNVSEPYL